MQPDLALEFCRSALFLRRPPERLFPPDGNDVLRCSTHMRRSRPEISRTSLAAPSDVQVLQSPAANVVDESVHPQRPFLCRPRSYNRLSRAYILDLRKNISIHQLLRQFLLVLSDVNNTGFCCWLCMGGRKHRTGESRQGSQPAVYCPLGCYRTGRRCLRMRACQV